MMNNNLKKATGVSFSNDEGGVVADAKLKQVMGEIYFGMSNIYLSLAVMRAKKKYRDKQMDKKMELIKGIADEMGKVLKDFEYCDTSESRRDIDVAKTRNLEIASRQIDDLDKMSVVIGIISGVFESTDYVINLFELGELGNRLNNLKPRVTDIERDFKSSSAMM